MSESKAMTIAPNEYSHEYDSGNAVDVLAQHLEQKLVEAMNERVEIDSRMTSSLMQFNGIYDEETLAKFKRSKVYIKMTRAKGNSAIGQLTDMLFPNDDKNWGIKPTPVPEISELLTDEEPALDENGQQYADAEGNVVTKSELARRKLQQIQDACDGMEKEINDQLVECRYNALSRIAISDAVIVGTGILKGPVVSMKMDRVFVKQGDEFVMQETESLVPTVEVVRPWDFYPDPSAATIEEADYVFERRYMSKRQIQALAKRKGFSKENVTRVLQLSPNQTQHKASFQADVRKLAGLNNALNDSRYETWEFHGTIEGRVLIDLGILERKVDPELAKQQAEESYEAIVFYCGGVVLGAKLHLLNHYNDSPYRVFNWEENDACIFGYGLPSIVTDEQAVLNSVWRMILDNGAATAGPQVGVNKKFVSPENGVWEVEPFKLWNIEGTAVDIKQVFSTFEFNSNLNDLSAIYQVARVLFDEISGVPMLQQGEQGQSTQTLGGMSMLMNAANTVRRRQVRMWDDCITTPMISDFYHFNMLRSKKNEIKGDYQVDARGTGALLVKETQAQALTNFLSVVGSNPVFTPVLQIKAAEILRQWAKTQGLPDSILPTNEELEKFAKQQEEKSQGQPQDPSIAVEQMRAEQQKAKHQFEMELAKFNAQNEAQQVAISNQIKQQQIAADMQANASRERIELMKLAQSDKMNTENLMTELKKNQAKLDQDWQQFMAEVQIKKQAGLTANYGLQA